MPNPYRKSWTARPTDELRNAPEYIRSRAAQGALLDTVGGPSDLANYLSDYFYTGLNSLLDVGGLSPYDVPQSLGTTNRRPIPGGSPQLEQALVQSGAMGPSTGTTQEIAMRMGLGLLDPTPVGVGSLTGPRGKNVFYSGLLDTAQNAPMQKGSADQWMGYLQNQPGVKQAELEWTAVEDWLKSQDGPVTRQELGDYLQGAEIQVEEVVKGGLNPDSTAYSDIVADAIDEYVDQNKRRFDIVYDEDEHGFVLIDENGEFFRDYGGSVQSYDDRNEAISELEYILDEEARRMPEDELLASVGFEEERLLSGGGAEYSDYTYGTDNTGGENYRELLLTIPTEQLTPRQKLKDPVPIFVKSMREKYGERWFESMTGEENSKYDALIDEIPDGERPFETSHWQEPNVVAHVRFNDRTTPEGEDVLFLEEIQSDWGQTARDKGYKPEQEEIDAAGKAREQAEIDYYSAVSDSIFGKTNSPEEAGRLEERVDNLVREVARHPKGSEDETMYLMTRSMMTGLPIEEMAKLVEKRRIANDMEGQLVRASDQAIHGAPKGPFIGNTEQWTSLTLKRMMKYAADNGYDRIAWTPGNVQADRYDLSKHIDEVHLSGSNLVARNKYGRDVINTTGVTNKTLKDYIGEELAEKLLAQPERGTLRSLYGTDIQVGGEGMKAFYDKMVPNMANKIGKKHGAKTEVITIETSKGPLQALSIPVTGKLKSAAQGGFPYYAVPLTVGGSGLLAEEQRRRRPVTSLLNP
jgi:hypothetical protein